MITDADPVLDSGDDREPQALYPAPGDVVKVSHNTTKMKESEDSFVKVFHGLKTLEYDLALHADNRSAMLAALKELPVPAAQKAFAAAQGLGYLVEAKAVLAAAQYQVPA